jgi:hypothetical protein
LVFIRTIHQSRRPESAHKGCTHERRDAFAEVKKIHCRSRAPTHEELGKTTRAVADARVVDLAADVSSQQLTVIKAVRCDPFQFCRARFHIACAKPIATAASNAKDFRALEWKPLIALCE